jgi:hypothetical protein
MVTLRNLAIGLIRQAGHTKIAATIRRIKTDPHLLLTILGLNSDPQTAHDQQEELCGSPCRARAFQDRYVRFTER